jgi:hypothetical protein
MNVGGTGVSVDVGGTGDDITVGGAEVVQAVNKMNKRTQKLNRIIRPFLSCAFV